MKCIYGLGNPGNQYRNTRHNAGDLFVQYLSDQLHIPLSQTSDLLLYGTGTVQNVRTGLYRSSTYMNHSGEALPEIKNQSAKLKNILIAYDDMDLSPGQVRIRPEGSAGGHRGMQSIIDTAETREIPRIRFGIGTPPPESPASEFVLSRFSSEERRTMQTAFQNAREGVTTWITSGIVEAMNLINGR